MEFLSEKLDKEFKAGMLLKELEDFLDKIYDPKTMDLAESNNLPQEEIDSLLGYGFTDQDIYKLHQLLDKILETMGTYSGISAIKNTITTAKNKIPEKLVTLIDSYLEHQKHVIRSQKSDQN